MGGLMKNAEFKAVAGRLLALALAAAAALCLLCLLQAQWLSGRLADQSAAVVGRAVAAHPEAENDIVGAFTRGASPEDAERGRAILASYGYGAGMPVASNPILGGALTVWMLVAVGFTALCAAAAFLITAKGYSLIYRKVRSISDAAEKVVEGNFGVKLPAGSEGEFDVLGHRFNQMANRLQRNVEQLTAEKVFLKNVISDISHQLKTPLATLVVYNDLMSEDERMDAEHRRGFLEMGRQQLQRLEWLIQSLLKMARLEAGSIGFRRERVALRDVADAAAAALATTAAEARVAVAVRERHAGAACTGDAEWLTEAVINIVKNGIEHSGEGGCVEIELDETPLTASISVADRGCGIDPADLPRIFDRFYRSARTVKPNSIGIGLAMSKAIVEGQGGSIAVRSEKNKGTEFIIVFLKTIQNNVQQKNL